MRSRWAYLHPTECVTSQVFKQGRSLEFDAKTSILNFAHADYQRQLFTMRILNGWVGHMLLAHKLSRWKNMKMARLVQHSI